MPWNLVGNERAVRALARMLAAEAPPHAYLLTGPERVGKATLALRLAQALNCTSLPAHPEAREGTGGGAPSRQPEGGPCRACEQCRRIEAGVHADVLTVSVAAAEEGPQRKVISVDQVRDVERAAALSAFEGRTRVVIIDPADAMSVEAQNAFLKTLEEPPPNVVFILVTAREDRLLPTVNSRCRRLEFSLLPGEAVEQALVAEGIEEDRARLLSRLAGGRPGRALAMAREPGALERRRETIEACRAVPRMSLADRMDLAGRLSERFKERREPVLEALAAWRDWWRDVLLVQSGAGDGAANADLMAELREDAGRYPRRDVAALLRAIGEARRHLEMNVQSRIALDVLMMQVPAKGSERSAALEV